MIRLALILFLAVPGVLRAGQGDCGRKVSCPHTPTLDGKSAAATRKILMKAIREAVAAHDRYQEKVAEELQLRKALENKQEGVFSSDEWKWALARALQYAEKEEMEKKLQRVVELTQKAYGIKPKLKSGTVQGGMLKGRNAEWTPRIIPGRQNEKTGQLDLKYYKEIQSPDLTVHLGIDFNGKNAGQAAATTLPDGEVIIPIRTLQDAEVWKNPDWLAATLFHESVHFTELITNGWDTLQEIEIRAYEKVVAHAGAFNLNKNKVRKLNFLILSFRNRLRAIRRVSISRKTRHGRTYPYSTQTDLRVAHKEFRAMQNEIDAIMKGRDALEKTLVRESFERQKRWEEQRRRKEKIERENEKRRLQEEASRRTDVLWEIARIACWALDPDAFQKLLDKFEALEPYNSNREYYLSAIPERQSSCQRKMYAKMLRRLADGDELDADWVSAAGIELFWQPIRAKEAEAYQKKVDLMDSYLDNCNFEPIWQYDDTGLQYLRGFKRNKVRWRGEDTSWGIHHFVPGMTFGQVKVSLLFTWACLAVNDGFTMNRTCNDGLRVANENWNEKGFKEKIISEGLISDNNLSHAWRACMEYLRDNFKPNTDFEDFQNLLDKSKKDHRDFLKRKQEERERNSDDCDDDIDDCDDSGNSGNSGNSGSRSGGNSGGRSGSRSGGGGGGGVDTPTLPEILDRL